MLPQGDLGIDVGAFSAQIAGFQHEGDIAKTAAARLGATKCVVDDPPIPFLASAAWVWPALITSSPALCRRNG
jgi:hypothetical protein